MKWMVAVSVVLGGLLAGCGSDDDTLAAEDDRLTTTTEAPLTNDEFLEQTNALCHTGDGRRQQAAEQLFPDWPQTTPDQRATFVRIVGDIREGSQDAFAALIPPEDLQDEVDQQRAEADAAFAQLTDDPDLLLSAENPFALSDALAVEIGLTDCTSDWTPAQG